MNKPVEDAKQRTLFLVESIRVNFNMFKNVHFREKLILEKDGCDECFREKRVEWFLDEVLEKETYIKQ